MRSILFFLALASAWSAGAHAAPPGAPLASGVEVRPALGPGELARRWGHFELRGSVGRRLVDVVDLQIPLDIFYPWSDRPSSGRMIFGTGWKRELLIVRDPDGRHVVVYTLDPGGKEIRELTRVAAPPGGRARVHLSDRDELAAFTVDFGEWDTCPVLLSLTDAPEAYPIPCAEAGRTVEAALRAGGHLPPGAAAGAFRLRLTNVRYLDPSFLHPSGAELLAEVRVAGGREPVPARFVLRDGHVERCDVTPRGGAAR